MNDDKIIKPTVEAESLEGPDTTPEPALDNNQKPEKNVKVTENKDRADIRQKGEHIKHKINIYLILFIVLLIMTALIAVVAWRADRRIKSDNSIRGQILSDETLKDLASTNTQIGDAKQTITIAGNSIFGGRVLVKDSLDVAGTIKVGGSLNLNGITVAGNSSFETVQIANNLSVNGNGTIRGALNVGGTLTTSGGANFGGPVSASAFNIENLTVNQDLKVNRHIVTGGGTPSASIGTALGGGGTVSINGTDTAGTITVNTGSTPAGGGGTMANVTFVNAYANTPRIILTPVKGTKVGCTNIYTTRTNTGFSVYCNQTAEASATFYYDYIVMN